MSRLLSWICNVGYLAVLLVAAPVLIYRSITQGKYRDGWSEKLWGNVPVRDGSQPAVWFHAVSVGEVLQLQQVVKLFHEERPEHEVIVSCTTSTGRVVAEEKFPDCLVCYFPLDFTWAVRNAIKRLRPQLMVLVELELWPNFILEAERTKVPLALINGRISENSFRGYCKLRPLMQRLLTVFSTMAVQSPMYGERLKKLGGPAERIQVTGSIKFDGIQTDRKNSQTAEIREAFGIQPSAYVFIAGSTQDPEEKLALDSYRKLKPRYPELRLILVPRHKERFEEVASLVQSESFPLCRRSIVQQSGITERTSTDDDPVLLLDTLGELNACWGLADFAFVGGSLTNRGGQNMIEPAAYAAVVTFGPNTRNFKDVVDLILAESVAEVVEDQPKLQERLEFYLEHPDQGRALGERARELVMSQQGATRKTIDLLLELLPLKEKGTAEAA
ncbi:3-deoxy-D-manno-octulosonic acid transferase [Polystyrenella longa]|uniref:3-deoxy-D-manno-octulosonic acid transferase n=1 Tax=Polystyrenella longa TaxID=2528007 RepID=A0A518CM10_9PLAN|nr:3-deoxy-D-manno-octulosonic acid transferase [Polystyrenella longa]QDU80269.1 3-deoxy-D-manno-octulosonic acid transferase [Polystyrenella longa]